MPEETKPSEIPDAAKKKAQELSQAVQKLGLHDRLIFLGAAACLLFWLLRWYSVETFMGTQGSSGMHDKYIVGWIAALGTVLLSLVNMRLVPLEGANSLAKNPVVYLGLTILTFVFGPMLFMMDLPEVPPMLREAFQGGKTLWFWLAFGSALAAVAGAGLKFMQLRRSADGTAA